MMGSALAMIGGVVFLVIKGETSSQTTRDSS
jgi:hypothetical protein